MKKKIFPWPGFEPGSHHPIAFLRQFLEEVASQNCKLISKSKIICKTEVATSLSSVSPIQWGPYTVLHKINSYIYVVKYRYFDIF